MDRLLVASEYTDPCFYIGEVCAQLEKEALKPDSKVGLLLISKNIGSCGPILAFAKSFKIPTIIHSTNTGLAGTVLEPGNTWLSKLSNSLSTWKSCYPESKFVLRIDPIIPNHSSEAIIYTMMQMAKKHGVNDIRFSVMDCYPFVRRRFDKLHLNIPFEFQYPERTINSWASTIGLFAKDFGMNLNACAESINNSLVGSAGCASKEEWSTLGLDLEPCTFKQRELCTCTAKKYDLLKGKPCRNNCMYCYYSKGK